MVKTLLYKNNETGELYTFSEVKEQYATGNGSDLPIDDYSFMIIIFTTLLERHGGKLELINDDTLAWCNDYAEYQEADRFLSQEERDSSIKAIWTYIQNNEVKFLDSVKKDIADNAELSDRLDVLLRNSICRKLAQALVYIDNECLQMGDNYSDNVEFYCELAEIPFDDEKDPCEQANAAYRVIAAVKPDEMVKIIGYILNDYSYYISTLKSRLKYHDEIRHEVHPTILALKDMLSYLENMITRNLCNRELFESCEIVINDFLGMDLEVIRAGRLIGDTYYRYLSTDYFGVASNFASRVGDIITDGKEVFGIKYIYEAHAEYNRLNTPYNGYGIFFKRNAEGAIIADVYFYTRKGAEDANYKELCFTMEVTLTDIEEQSKGIAKKINQLAHDNLFGTPDQKKYYAITTKMVFEKTVLVPYDSVEDLDYAKDAVDAAVEVSSIELLNGEANCETFPSPYADEHGVIELSDEEASSYQIIEVDVTAE